MVNLIQPITVQQDYDGITHARRWASWNWLWRTVYDDDGVDFPLRCPKWTPDLASKWRTWRDGSSIPWIAIIISPWFFSGKIGFYSIGFRVCGATRWGQPTWACLEGGAPWWVVPPRGPSLVGLGSRNSHLFHKKSSQSFVPFRELLFLHKNNTMVVLLKTTSVRVSFIQIMQIRVPNKSKSVWKSRYGGHVSVPPPQVTLGSRNSLYLYKISSQSFLPLRELLFLHKNNTMVVLLKTMSVRG